VVAPIYLPAEKPWQPHELKAVVGSRAAKVKGPPATWCSRTLPRLGGWND
jgi:hypothetical protein